MAADGFYYWGQEGHGWWEAHNLRKIADLLDEVNKPFEEQIKRDFKKYINSQSYRASDHYTDPMTGISYPIEK